MYKISLNVFVLSTIWQRQPSRQSSFHLYMQMHPLSVQIDVYYDDETYSQLMILYKYQTFTNDFPIRCFQKGRIYVFTDIANP